jgi:hypothetical protein
MADKKERAAELLQGTLDLLILKSLERGAMHGYGVAEWIHESSQDVLRVEEGALYPALHRLELRGLLSAQWGKILCVDGRREETAGAGDRVLAADVGCDGAGSADGLARNDVAGVGESNMVATEGADKAGAIGSRPRG